MKRSAEAAIVHATSAILDDAETQVMRAAGLAAVLFVLVGALCALLIANSVNSEGAEPRQNEELALHTLQ